jgi:DNA processing protein
MSADDALRVAFAGAEAGVEPARIARRSGGAAALLRLPPARLHTLGATARLCEALARARSLDAAAWRRTLEAHGIACTVQGEDGYPERLSHLHDPPLALFSAGRRPDALAWPAPVVAIVGSRRAADHSLRLARRLAAFAAGRGALVVSGLALGVDGAAHEGALEAGTTLAVLGCGVDVAYPRRHARLAVRVREAGLLVSEYPPGTRAAPWRFPARNRLIAALADTVLVVEARERSGALITADRALELGRDVLAVPGSPSSTAAAGVNGLLRAGAGLVEDELDLAGWLGLAPPAPLRPPELRPGARAVLDTLADAPGYADELAARIGQPSSEVARALTELELEGLLARDGAGRFVPVRRPGDRAVGAAAVQGGPVS